MPIYINGGGNFAPLDESGRVPSSVLPSYVDDVLEYASVSAMPSTGESGKIYVAVDTKKTYRWSGSTYIEISPSLVESVAGRSGEVTLTKSDVGLGNVDNTSDLSKPISTATQAALDGKANANDARFADSRTPTDGSVTDAKIASGGLSASSINWASITEWAPNTAYAKGALVSFLGVAYRRSAAGTSGSTFALENWQQITPSINVVGTPSSLTADQNNYTLPAATDIVRIAGTAARTITGIVAGVSGQAHLLINVGSFAITLSHQSTSSSAANRFAVPWAGNYVLDANGGAALIVYDSTSAVWRVV